MSNPFSDEYRREYKQRTEYSWLTDIEKIQADINRDLERSQSAAQTPESEYAIPEQPDNYTWPDDVQSSNPWLVHRAETPATTPSATTAPLSPGSSPPIRSTSGFYRETIKSTPQRGRSWAKTVAVILLVCTLGMGSLGFGIGSAFYWSREQTRGITHVETGDNPNTPIITSSQYVFDPGSRPQSGTIADMVQLIEPAVVGVMARFETNRPPAAGSGTIFAENEDRIFIATGEYVIRGAVQIHVRIAGSQPLLARRVDGDPRSGLAVISLDKQDLLDAGIDSVVIAAFGDSDDMQVGDTVFVIGNARNEGNSVTRGIISAGKQELVFPHYTLTVLQTDAAINYGNSGGPLINISGEIIGINIDRAGAQFNQEQVEGIGYSIAGNVAYPILRGFIDPERPAIGITARTLTEDLIELHDLDMPAMGVFVYTVTSGGAADRGGIRPHDVITAFGGEPVFTMEELQQAIRQSQIGDSIEVMILRGGLAITLDVQLLAFIQ